MITSYFQKKNKGSLKQDNRQDTSVDTIYNVQGDELGAPSKRLRMENEKDELSNHVIDLNKSTVSVQHPTGGMINQSAQALISQLTEVSWLNELIPFMSKSSFVSLAQFIAHERYLLFLSLTSSCHNSFIHQETYASIFCIYL